MVKFPWCLNQTTQNGFRMSQKNYLDQNNYLEVTRRKSDEKSDKYSALTSVLSSEQTVGT